MAKRLNTTLERKTRHYHIKEEEEYGLRMKKGIRKWVAAIQKPRSHWQRSLGKQPPHRRKIYLSWCKECQEYYKNNVRSDEAAIILKRVTEMGYENMDIWEIKEKDLSSEFSESKYPRYIKRRYDLIINCKVSLLNHG